MKLQSKETATFTLKTGNYARTLPRPAVMGVINRSIDSFFNANTTLDAALRTADEMVAAGVDIIDIGGEATNPNVVVRNGENVQQEIDCVAETIAAICSRFDVLLSVDTSQPAVMRAAVAAGAELINDQRALTLPDALATAVELNVAVCLMQPTFGRQPDSMSLVECLQETLQGLREKADRAMAAGIDAQQIILDPGFGGGNYGRSVAENFYLLQKLPEIVALGFPLLVGWSRKSMIGEVLGGVPASERLYGSIAAATLAGVQGASIIRVHDVKATKDAMQVLQYYMRELTK